jgi:hypothetical protein
LENTARKLSPDAAQLLRGLTEAATPPNSRKRIRSDENVPVKLNDRERELIVEHSFAEPELTDRRRVVPELGEPPIYYFSLDDLDELAGYVAAEANHAKDKKLQKEWDWLYARLAEVLDSYTDDED